MRERIFGAWADRAVVLGALVVTLLALPLVASASPTAARAPGARQEALARAPAAGASSPEGARRALLAARERAAAEGGVSLTPSKTRPYYVCPEGPCDAIVDPKPVRRSVHGAMRLALPGGRPLEGSGERGGLDPQDLQSAYDIPVNGGAAAETIAIVDAEGYANAERDLAVYRERYGLPPCTHANGCFRKVNQKGQERQYPGEGGGWETEQALDLDMVSAACPECHILLVQADEPTELALGEAENTAVRLGAIEVSNSWGSAEQVCALERCEGFEQKYFDHPGVMLFFAAGDDEYDNSGAGAGFDSPDYPASLPSVVAVGGTALHRAGNARGWTEETWYEPSRRIGGGSGCSRFPKPAWQDDPGCKGRMTVDVAADAACETAVSTYARGEWLDVCGTSAASPLVAGIEAHAEESIRALPGAEAFYEAAGLNDITVGVNGKCSDALEVAYFCRAQVGYDGPTGNGSPDGPLVLGVAAPFATTRPPSGVGSGQATLAGEVSPHGLPTAYRFEYGTTAAYGASVPVPEGSLVTGQRVTETVGELQGDTVYHYRLVASNADGTSYGADYAFSTGTPVLSGVSPATGPADGGETVSIVGSNLLDATAVHFGSTEASEFTVESDTSISAHVPPGSGAAQVSVTTLAGTSAPGGEARFVYDPPGPVLAWGYNEGDLGDGELLDSAVPVEVAGLSEAQALSSGYAQSLALLANDTVAAWGENRFGEVGDGTYELRTSPVQVCAEGVKECPGGPYLEEVTQLSAGGLQSLALLANGTVAAWGGNLYGDLATDTERNPFPLPVCTKLESPCKPENYLHEVVEVAAGADFSLARLKNGQVMAWGENTDGELGTGTTSGPETCALKPAEPCSRVPVPVQGLGTVTAIATGVYDAFALLKNGTVMAWGDNEEGQLGDDSTSYSSAVPEPVCALGETTPPCKHELTGVRSLSGSFGNGYALLENGTVASWGANEYGQLGDGSYEGTTECKIGSRLCATTPVLVKGLNGVRTLAQGDFATGGLVALEDGAIETWGRGHWGELGDGSFSASDTPVGVCKPFASGPCPEGPFLYRRVTALASGYHDLLAMPASSGPIVGSLTPDVGPAAGGTRVTILGGRLQGATAVDFGATPALEYEVRDGDEIVAVAPPGSATATVTVSTPGGTSSTEAEDQFTYEGPPAVATDAATGIALGAATLNAIVDPNGVDVSECRFEYGTTPAYGASVPCSPTPGAGTKPVAVSAALPGLTAATTYYFRVLATNAYGSSTGTQQSFTSSGPLPEIGRCLKQAQASARYTNKSCTTLSAGADSGRYEWSPWPLAKPRFTLDIKKPPVLESNSAKDAFSCATGTATGEYTGTDTASVTLVLTGCRVPYEFDVECNTTGAAAGEVRAGPLPMQLGFIQDGATPTVGWALNAPTESALFECANFPSALSLNGSVIAETNTLDQMKADTKLEFDGSRGVQNPQSLEGGPTDVLTLTGQAPPFSLGLSLDAAATIDNDEEVEIKAVG